MASHLARIWQTVLFQEPSADRVLSIDPFILNELDPQDFWALTQMYSRQVQEPSILALDREENVVRLGTLKYLSKFKPMLTAGYLLPELALPFVLPRAQAAARDKIAVPAHIVGANKIPRPRNAFIIYRMNKSISVRAANPNAHNNQISIIIGKMWQNETSAVRNRFKQLAENEKKLHLQLHPNYRYQPRKPSEKKRRVTKKKPDAIVSQHNTAASSQDSGYLHGNPGEIRSATLPLSAQGETCIAIDNNRMVGCKQAVGFGLTPSREYSAAQEADIDLIGEHMGPEFYFDDPSPTNVSHLGEPAEGFDFALHAYDFPEYAEELVEYLKNRT